MSSLGPKKSLLTFKTNNNTSQKLIYRQKINQNKSEIIKRQQDKQKEIIQEKQQIQAVKQIQKKQVDQQQIDGKTKAQKSFELVKKKRMIEKHKNQAKISSKQLKKRFHKTLSKQADHGDLFKIGQKIQKGY